MAAQRLAAVVPFPSLKRPYRPRSCAQDGARAQVAFVSRDDRDGREAPFMALGPAMTLASVRGAA